MFCFICFWDTLTSLSIWLEHIIVLQANVILLVTACRLATDEFRLNPSHERLSTTYCNEHIPDTGENKGRSGEIQRSTIFPASTIEGYCWTFDGSHACFKYWDIQHLHFDSTYKSSRRDGGFVAFNREPFLLVALLFSSSRRVIN